ncbi:MAG: sigma-70 family RNA polymerase sigma factor [Propionibacteriaceae bacterium]
MDRVTEYRLVEHIEAGVVAEAVLAGIFAFVPTAVEQLQAVIDAAGQAKDELIAAHLDMAYAQATTQARRLGLPAAELKQEAAYGLVLALAHFDAAQGNRFATYAMTWVRARIAQAATTRCGELGLGPSPARSYLAIQREARRLEGQGQVPCVGELAHACSLPEQTVIELLHYRPPSHVEIEIAGVCAEEEVEISTLLAALPECERQIVQRRFGLCGEPASWAALAAELELSVRSTRAIGERALVQLRVLADELSVA